MHTQCDTNYKDLFFKELCEKFAKMNGTFKDVKEMKECLVYKDGAVPAKIKCLVAALCARSLGCCHAMSHFIAKAKHKGATEQELCELMGVATAASACVSSIGGLKSYKAYLECQHECHDHHCH